MPGHRIPRALVLHRDVVPTATFVTRRQPAPADHGLRTARRRLSPQTAGRLHPHLRAQGQLFGDAMSSIEPWLRGSETDVPAVGRAVLHALQLAEEDLRKWCGNLSDAEVNVRPAGAASVAFHIRHLARSVDRVLTYAEGRSLS